VQSPLEIRPLLEELLRKLDQLADRPIHVTVTSELDGREIAQAVFRNLRERRVAAYDTF